MRARRSGLLLGPVTLANLMALAAAGAFAACDTAPTTPAEDAGAPPPSQGLDDAGSVAPDATPPADAASPFDAGAPAPSAGKDAGHTAADAATDSAPPDASPSAAKQSLVWVWQDYANSLAAVVNNASSFTHISPALYQLNYDYVSGLPQLLNGDDNYDGLSSSDITQKIHDAGLKCIPFMYAGAGNGGTDQGIQNVLSDSPAGAQSSFISSMVSEGVTKGYDGFNLDWEVSNTDDSYSDKLIAFLGAFKKALNAQNMVLSIDIAGFYIEQCNGSGGTGLVDLTKLGPSVDQAIIEDYATGFNNAGASCPASLPTSPSSVDCDDDFGGGLDAMCDLPSNVVSIGLIVQGTNPFASQALAGISSYGFRSVAIWPGNGLFLDPSGIPNGATWYSLLAGFLQP